MTHVGLLAAGAGEGIDFGTVLFHIFVVLVAAKVAAELAERARIPAVLGEIVAGIIIGPSLLNIVEPDQILAVLGEIGVIMLLLNVGLEMDIGEIARVGKASLTVAVIGVAAPFIGGAGTAIALGEETKTAIFVGAALTATSVGITARVFGDLKALSSVESRIVLGAAVADDVLGLIILTVVTRIVVDGSVSAGTILSTIGLALAFLAVTGVVGTKTAPWLFTFAQRWSRSPSTLVALAFAFTLGFSTLADAAKLAPIIGAFMAGLALGRTKQAHRLERDLAPIGHVFIPVFFLSIGISTDVGAMLKPSVLAVAGALTVVAIVGKLLAAVGARGTKSDKWLIGFGMIPRGEVGLIFAAIGLSTGVLGDDLYAALIVMVLVTTVATPPLLRWKLGRTAAPVAEEDDGSAEEPVGGWLTLGDDSAAGRRGGTSVVELNAVPPRSMLLPLALDAAQLAASHRPSSSLIDWFDSNRQHPVSWDRPTTEAFIALLRMGNPRAWRFLETLGVLERALPEVSQAIRARRSDPSELDPLKVLRFPTVDRLGELTHDGSDTQFALTVADLEDPSTPDRLTPLLLAALVLDLGDVIGDPDNVARSVLGQLSIESSTETETAALVGDATLLASVLHDPTVLNDVLVSQLADHVGTGDRLRRLYLLTIARGELEPLERAFLDELVERIGSEVSPDGAASICDQRREAACRLAGDPAVAERIAHAPRSYVLTHDAEELVRQARLAEPAPQPGRARVAVSGHEETGQWRVDIASLDRPGLLASIARSLNDLGLDIVHASLAAWADRVVLDSFIVRAQTRPAAREIAERVEAGMRESVRSAPMPDVSIRFDNDTLPWHTACLVDAPDHPGILAGVTAAFAAAGVNVHDARILSQDGTVADRFALSTRDGRKLDAAAMDRIRGALAGTAGRAGRRVTR